MGNQGQLYFGLFLTSDILLMAIILLSGFLALAVIVSMMRIYKKCGKLAISVIIPIWGQIVLFQITGIAWWYIFIPIVNIIMIIKAYIVLAKKFGKGAGFAIGMIFLPMIFIPLLSFYDYVGDEKNEKIEEPIYNPFNQTDVEPVNVEEPIAPVIPVAPKEEVSVSDLEKQEPNTSGIFGIPAIPTEPVGIEEHTSEIVGPVVNEEDLSVEPVGSFNSQNMEIVENVGLQETMISEIPVVNTVDVQNNEDVESVDSLEQTIIEPVANNIENPTVQDIADALNINREPSQVAFNSSPVVETAQEENVELDKSNKDKTQVEEAIELPEIAAKVCSACGVSLAENINFCTSCGTKL